VRADIADNAIDYSSSFEGRLTTDESDISTNQSDISDLQTDSGSFSTRVTTNETDISNLQTDSGSFSTRATTNESDISNLETDSGSFSTRVTTLENEESSSYAVSASHAVRADIADSVIGTIESASFAQNAFDYSSSFEGRLTTDESDISTNETDISNLQTDSGSFSTRVTTLETDETASYADYATSASHALRADISDNAIDYSSSFEGRLTTDESDISTNQTDISNLQTDSGSFSTRVTNNETDISNLQTDSGSFSTRVTTNETDITNLETDSGSFSTRVTTLENEESSSYAVSASHAVRADIADSVIGTIESASFAQNAFDFSGSFNTRITTDESDISTNQTDISNLQTDSGSFSTRVTTVEELTGSYWTGSGGNIHRMSNVGIGIANSSYPLYIADSAGEYIRMALSADLRYYHSLINHYSATPASSKMIFAVNTAPNIQDQLLTLVGNSYVGIGTTDPSVKLEVAGDALITGSLTVNGLLTAQEFHTSYVSSSIVYASGSTKFGDTGDDIHQFTGSIRQSGSDSYFMNSVGIGTTDPNADAKLHVSGGDIYVTGNGGSGYGYSLRVFSENLTDYIRMYVDGTTSHIVSSETINIGTVAGNIGIAAEAGYVQIQSSAGNHMYFDAGNMFYFRDEDDSNAIRAEINSADGAANFGLNGGYVGIGTTNPDSLLHISGTSLPMLHLQRSHGGASTIQYENNEDSWFSGIDGSENFGIGKVSNLTDYLFVITTANDYVGIGTMLPQEHLHVWNNVSASAFYGDGSNLTGLTADNAYWTASGGEIHRLSNVGIGTTDPGYLLEVSGSSKISGETYTALWVEGNSQGHVILKALGATSDYRTYDVLSSGDKFFIRRLNDDGTALNANVLTIDDDNVGIGTTNPSEKLHVSGNISISNSDESSHLYIDNDATNYNSGIMHKSIGTNKWFAGLRYNRHNNYTIYEVDGSDSERFTIIAGGNVGIGTTNPSALLHLSGSGVASGIQFGTDVTLYRGASNQLNTDNNFAAGTMYAGGGAGSMYASYFRALSTGVETHIGGNTNGFISFHSSASEGMRLTSGNVGIGTTTPEENLHVWSNVSASAYYGDGSNLTGLTADNAYWTASGGNIHRLSNVSIGTTDNSFGQLQIEGDGTFPQFTIIDNVGSVARYRFTAYYEASTGPSLIIDPNSTANHNLVLDNSGTGMMGLLVPDGNIGIGTTDPSVKLEVAGDALITGSLTVNGLLTAQEFHTSYVSASIVYSSGSTKFGDSEDDIHQFTGSLTVSGSIYGDGEFVTGVVSSSHAVRADISDNAIDYSSSFEGRLTTDESDISDLQTDSGSFSTRVTTLEAEESSSYAVSASHAVRADIADSVIGTIESASFAQNAFDYSASFSTRITTDESDISTNQSDISNLQTDSGSFSTRVTTNETDITNLETDSGSFSTRVTTNETDITKLETDSGSFSTRVTTTEESASIWKKNGGDIYVSDTTNYVGIGLTNPVVQLHVSGASRFLDNMAISAGKKLRFDWLNDGFEQIFLDSNNDFSLGSNAMIYGFQGSNGLHFFDTDEWVQYITLKNNKVGIGTTDPEEQLHVWSNVSASAYYGDGSNLTGLTADNAYWTASAGEIHRLSNVGIGTTNPDNILHAYQDINTYVRISVENPNTGNAAQAGLQLVSATSQLTLAAYASSYSVTSFADRVALFGDTTAGGINIAALAATGDIRLMTGGTNERVRINNTGYVGIGTDNPSVKLEVAGDALITGSLTVNGILTAQEFHTSYVSSSIVYASGSTKFGDSGDDIHQFTGSIRQSGSDSYFMNNVGIGTTNPGTSLEVYGTNEIIRITADTTGGNPYFSFYQTTTRRALVQFLDANNTLNIVSEYGDIAFEAASSQGSDSDTEYMRIQAGGNVGIGTVTPEENLHVWNNVSASTYYGSSLNIRNTIATSAPEISLTGDAAAAYLRHYNTGRGDTVFSNPAADSTFLFTNNSTLFGVGTLSSHPLIFATNDTERMRITNTGDIGIGTNNPDAKLHVSGTFQYGDYEQSNFATFASGTEYQGEGWYRISSWNNARGICTVYLSTRDNNAHNLIEADLTFGGYSTGNGIIIRKNMRYNPAPITKMRLSTEAQYIYLDLYIQQPTVYVGDIYISTRENQGVAGGNYAELSMSYNPIIGSNNVVIAATDYNVAHNIINVSSFNRGGTFIGSDNDEDYPTFRFSGSLTTGMFSPAVNEVALSTAATERFRIDSDGNVGIGTTVPQEDLHVWSNVSASEFYGDGSNLTGISADNLGDVATSASLWKQNGGDVYVSDTTNFVGIGTTNPTRMLHVTEEAQIDLLIVSSSGGWTYLTAQGSWMQLRSNVGSSYIRIPYNNDFVIISDRLGIGVTPDTGKELDVDGISQFRDDVHVTGSVSIGGSTNTNLYLKNPGGSGDSLIWWLDSTGADEFYIGQTAESSNFNFYNFLDGSFPLILYSDGDVRFIDSRIIMESSSGYVGIGTMSPEEQLHVWSNVSASTYYGDGSNLTGLTADNAYWTESAGEIHRMSNVGIGTNNPSAKLTVVNGGISVYEGAMYVRTGSVNSGKNVGLETPGLEIAQLGNISGNYALLKMAGWAAADGNYIQSIGIANNVTDMVFGVYDSGGASNEYMRLSDAGAVTVAKITGSLLTTGNVGIGVSVPDTKLDVNGGIKAGNIGGNTDFSSSIGQIQFNTDNTWGSPVIIDSDDVWGGNSGNPTIQMWRPTGAGDPYAWYVWKMLADPNGLHFKVDRNVSASEYGDYQSSFTDALTMDLYGNVGIQTADPRSDLHVWGNASASAFYGDGSNLTGLTADNAYWTASAGEIHRISNVGIGTINPSALLHLQRNESTYAINLVNTRDRAGIKIQASTAGTELFTVSRGANGMNLQSVGTDGSTAYAMLINPFGGYVGIGLTNPSTTLEVAGDALITGSMTVNGILYAQEFHTSYVSSSIVYASGSTKFGDTKDDIHQFTGSVEISGTLDVANGIYDEGIQLSFNDNPTVKLWNGSAGVSNGIVSLYNITTERVRIRASGETFFNGGNVGIGTNDPEQLFDVNGISQFRDDVHVTGSIFVQESGSFIQAVGIGTDFPMRFETVNTIDRTSGAKDDGIISVDGGFIIHADRNSNGTGITRALELYEDTDFILSAWAVSGEGRVGIGTHTASMALDVVGNVTASAFYGDGSNLTGINADNLGDVAVSASIWQTSASYAWLNDGNDEVGIGVSGSDIDAKFHIFSNETGSRAFLVEGQNGALFQVFDELSGSLFAVSDISGLPILEVFDDDKVVMGKYAENTLVVTGSKVGIGTDAPQGVLEIQENDTIITLGSSPLSAGYGGIWFNDVPDSSNYSIAAHSDSDLFINVPSTNDDIIFRSNNSATMMTITGDGLVGIGVTLPTHPLQVAGEISSSTWITAGQTFQTRIFGDASGARLQFGQAFDVDSLGTFGNHDSAFIWNSINRLIRIQQDSTDVMVIQTDGRVGIGTTNPQYTLQVNGGIRADNTTESSSFEDVTQTYPVEINYFTDRSLQMYWSSKIFNMQIDGDQASAIHIGDEFYITGSNGWVGIDTANPRNHLQIGSNPGNYSGNDLVVSNANGSIAVGNSAAGYAYISANNPLILNTTGNNIGLGSTHIPSEQLHVWGNVSASAFYGDGSNLTGISADNAYWTGSWGDGSDINRESDVYVTGSVHIAGTLYASAKSFDIPHPSGEGRLTYGALEGPEYGVYYRGKMKGEIIELPSYWQHLVDENSITVELTAIGKYQKLYVDSATNKRIIVKTKEWFSKVSEFYFTVFGERKDIDKIKVD